MPWNKSGNLKGPRGESFRADGNGAVVGLTVKDFGIETGYAAFPSSVKLPDGRLFVVWRGGTDHVVSRDGTIECAYSSDNGNTWSDRTVLYDLTGTDYRDPAITLSRDGKKLWMVYFKGSAANAAMGCYFRTSTNDGLTWSAESRIENQPYAAICSPIVELPSGVLFATWYGKANAGDARDSVWYATSTNQGTSWSSPVQLVSGAAIGTDAQEPWVSMKEATMVITYRHGGAASIGTIRSVNAGSTWSAPTASFAGSGRPATVITDNNTLVCFYRQAGGFRGNGMMRWSTDFGVNWSGENLCDETYGVANSSGWMYTGPVEVAPNVIFACTSIEVTGQICDLTGRYVLASSGISPYGDTIPDAPTRTDMGRDSLAIIDSFARQDSPTLGRAESGQLWNSLGGATIRNGMLDDRSANNTPRLHWIDSKTDSYDIEADFLWSGNPGFGIVFRRVDDLNFHLLTVETGGSNFRLYRFVNGAATALHTTSSAGVVSDVFFRLRVVNVKDVIRVYLDGALMATITDTTNSTARGVGMRTNSVNSTSYHLCRYFRCLRRAAVRYA